MANWVSSSDKLPSTKGVYIVAVAASSPFDDTPEVTAAFYDCGSRGFFHMEQHSQYEGRYRITHWMPLPCLPSK